MPTLDYALICENCLEDPLTKNFSYINVFDELTMPGFPAFTPNMYLITQWSGYPGEELSITFIFVNPDGSTLSVKGEIAAQFKNRRVVPGICGSPDSEAAVKFSNSATFARRTYCEPLIINAPGIYTIEVLANDITFKTLPLLIKEGQ